MLTTVIEKQVSTQLYSPVIRVYSEEFGDFESNMFWFSFSTKDFDNAITFKPIAHTASVTRVIVIA